MLPARSSFKRVIELITDLEEDVDNLEERLWGSVCPIPQDLYNPGNDLIRYCRRRIERADKFRRDHRKKFAVWFFDLINLSLGVDQIAQHESQLKNCGKAVKLAIKTTDVL